jgi:hypothetical protein
MSPDLIERLQAMRDDVGKSIDINSGIRCPAHNAKVGGKPDSEHIPDPVTGLTEGADLKYSGSKDRQLFTLTTHLHFRRIGIASNFFHVGTRESKAQDVTWIYPPKQKKE